MSLLDTAEGEGVIAVDDDPLVFGVFTLLSLVRCSLFSVAMDRFRGSSESSLTMVVGLEFCIVVEESLL